MGILKNGPNGLFTGKVGNMVGRIVEGRNVITGPYDEMVVAFTANQLDQQAKFGMMSSFLSNSSELIKLGFKPKNKKHGPVNLAVSHNLKQAVGGVSPDFEILYSKICLSAGELKNPINIGVQVLPDGVLRFNWELSAMVYRYANLTDQLMIMIFDPEPNKFSLHTNVASRGDLAGTVKLNPGFKGDVLHCYIFFTGYKGIASNTTYLKIDLH